MKKVIYKVSKIFIPCPLLRELPKDRAEQSKRNIKRYKSSKNQAIDPSQNKSTGNPRMMAEHGRLLSLRSSAEQGRRL